MMILKMPARLSELDLLFATLRAEVIAHICLTGRNQNEAKKIWLYTVLNELLETEEYSSIQHIPDSLQSGLESILTKLEVELNA